MTAPSTVSGILPTVATPDRTTCLTRALGSVLAQEGVRVDPIVVANGSDCDPVLLGTLARRRHIRLLHRDESGRACAISAGRDLVDAPYFAELDDDDWLLPGALATRAARLDADPAVDVVVSKGFLRRRAFLPGCQIEPVGFFVEA
jgi:succinoglycan biosynthesis protein ExoO